jgi:hypothetical protein
MKSLPNTSFGRRWAFGVALCFHCAIFAAALQAQVATGPEQDCFGALPVNRVVITQPVSYSGAGLNLSEVVPGVGCATTPKTNSSWYRVNVGMDGTLAFRITPLNGNDDYNFVVFRFPAGAATQTAGCIQMTASPAANIVACNFAPGNAQTGLDNTLANQFASFSPALSVRSGETYMIYISNRTGGGGFTLDFGASTQGVIPSTPTFPVATASLRANQMNGCGNASSLTITFSEPILRGTVQPSTFTLRGPNNQEFSVTSVACDNCPPATQPDSNTRRNVAFRLNVSPTITLSGTYTLALSTAMGAVALRNIDNSIISLPPTNVVVNVGGQPEVSSSLPVMNNTTSFCLGKSVTLSTADAGVGTQYQWLREGLNGALIPVNGATGRTLDITGGYAELQTSANDSSSVVIVTRTVNFRVRVSDPNGCVRTSNPIAVQVSPGVQARITNAPAMGTLNPCRNEGVTLVAESGFQSYLWYRNFRPVDTARGRTFFVRDAGLYSVETVDNNGCRNLSLSVEVNPRDIVTPVISGSAVNCANPMTGLPDSPVTLSIRQDSSYQSFRWINGATRQPVSGANGASISVLSGSYFVEVTSRNGCIVTSDTFTVRIGDAPPTPTISGLSQGLAVSLCPGDSYPLFGPEGFPRYQWYRDNAPIEGATNRRFDADRPGNYAVQVFTVEGCASALSSPPVVLVGGRIIPAVIRSASGSFTTCRGTSLQVSVDLPDSLLRRATIEWTRVGVPGLIGTLPVQMVSEEGEYRVSIQFTDNSPCAVSTTVTVRVVDNPAPLIITPNGNNTFCQGSSLTLDAGADFVSYQWFRVNGAADTPIPGATMRTLSVNTAGAYRLRVEASGGCLGTSAPFTVTELPAPASPNIRSRNGSFALCQNGSLELFVENVAQGVTYQWFRNGVALPGETRSSLIVISIGAYTVEATSPNGCTSRPNAPANVTQAELPSPPSFPLAITICPNGDTTLVAPAGFMSYQWLSGAGAAAQPIAGETNRQFRITRGGLYSLRIQDMRGCFNTSNTIAVSQTEVVVRIDTIDAGVRFRASSTPAARLFQWLLNGMNIPGATDSIFAPRTNGDYSVRVTDINGCVQTSSARRFQVTPPVLIGCQSNCGPSSPSVLPTIRGDSTIGAPGDTVIFSIRLPSLGTLRPGARIDATVCFNATILEPLPPLPAGTISAGVRCITLPLTIPADTSKPLFNLPFRAALGNDSITALVITSRLSPGGATLPATASYFRLSTISYAGGPRLIGPPPRMRLTPSRPNPVGDDGVALYTIENPNGVEQEATITINDIFGRTVKTLPAQKLKAATGEIPFNVADLPPGVYFLRVQTQADVQVQKIHVLR